VTARIIEPPLFGQCGGLTSPTYHAAAIAWLKYAGADLQLIAIPASYDGKPTGMEPQLVAAWTQGNEIKQASRLVGHAISPEHALGSLLEHICGRLFATHVSRRNAELRQERTREREQRAAAA
jgi:hypothetical protein